MDVVVGGTVVGGTVVVGAGVGAGAGAHAAAVAAMTAAPAPKRTDRRLNAGGAVAKTDWSGPVRSLNSVIPIARLSFEALPSVMK
ncbi:unannotated protein [freshwater metagenome]|uniref:Unannotated protein n=1 Tax=freshwater metagenome TaxID=449393 RepID=A0A6J7NUM8_9ZZZZ